MRKFCVPIAVCLAVIIAGLHGLGRLAYGDELAGNSVGAVQRTIADSKLPADIKESAAAAKGPTYGKVYYLWPMSNGTFLFGISTPKGGVAFTIKTGSLTADPMIKVLLLCYEKQTPVYVFEDTGHPQVAAAIVTVAP